MFLVALLVASILAPFALAQAPTVWIAPSLQRVGQTDAAGSSTQAQIYAAKGEYESFQIIVKASSGALSNVNVSVSDLTGLSTISKSSVALFREQYVQVTSSSPNWGGSNKPMGAGVYPDGLIPFVDENTGSPASGGSIQAAPFSVASGQNQPIWVDVLVPRTAAAGQYTGTYTVTSNQGNASGTIALQVWNFTLPQVPTLRSSFAYFTASSTLANEELLRNRVAPLSVNASDESMLMANFGLGQQHLGFYSGADTSNCSMSAAPSVSSIQSAAAQQQKGLYLFDYSADEIDNCPNLFPTVKQWGYNFHQAGVDNLVTMTPNAGLMDDGSGTGRSAVDDWVVLPVMYDGGVSMIQQALAKGDKVWSYNTLVQDAYSPKWEIDFAPINFRVQGGFINQSLGLSGLLYWRVDDWNSSPWTNPYTFSSSGYPGEAVLVYPGSTVGVTGVAPSMRLKWIRDSVDDFDYITLLKQAGYGSFALQVAKTIGPDWTNWTRDINALEAARIQLGQKLDSLGGGGTVNPPSAASNPSPANGATGVSTTQVLSWTAGTNATSYDVYFGTAASPALATTVSGTSYQPSAMAAGTTYYWKIVARNSGGSTSSAIWSFATAAAAPLPGAPGSASPANGATAVSTSPNLGWAAGSNTTSCDIYVGTSSSPALVASNVTASSYQVSGLSAGTIYYWKVVGKNSAGSTSSAVWSFTTAPSVVQPPMPTAPASPSPANGATSVTTSPNLWWAADSNTTACDIYVGTTSSPAMVASNVSAASYQVNGLTAGTIYYWKVVAKNSTGSTSSAMWTFTTAASAPPPPPPPTSGPVAVTPASGSGLSQTFAFTFTDPAGYQTLSGMHVLVNTAPSGSNACWLYYTPSSHILYLSSNDTSTWSSMTAGSTGAMQNSQCSINMSGVTANGSGTTFTLTVPITFTSAFAGAKNIYMNATDTSGLAASYTSVGTWNVVSTTPAPGAATNPSPANGAAGVSTSPALSWTAGSNAASYDLYLGTSSTPALLKSGITGASYQAASLNPGTTYYWKLVSNNSGGSATSATWSFVTAVPAPAAATNPSPANGATGIATSATLAWTAGANATSYDVYLGTSSSPALVGNVTGTTYQANSLSAGTTYYWKVVAKNSSGSATSSIWQFATASNTVIAPAGTSVTPSSGAGLSQTFNFIYSDPKGYQTMTAMNVMFAPSFSGTNACWMYFDGKSLYLANDSTSTWNSAAIGSAATLQNSQCSVNAAGATASGAGTNFTLKVPVLFKSAFAGAKNIYMRAYDSSNLATSYAVAGTWTVQ